MQSYRGGEGGGGIQVLLINGFLSTLPIAQYHKLTFKDFYRLFITFKYQGLFQNPLLIRTNNAFRTNAPKELS